jgi:murein DD-endopeptidase MepM/ murein hydrolase activator NlpD
MRTLKELALILVGLALVAMIMRAWRPAVHVSIAETAPSIPGAEVHDGGIRYAEPVPDWLHHINARFDTVDCAYWGFQSGCRHWGTDIAGGGEGTPFLAPYDGYSLGCRDNGDGGPYVGIWIQYVPDFDRATEFLFNHFRDVAPGACAPGARIEAGQLLGHMRGDARHIHWQVKTAGVLVDPELYWESH